MSDMVFFSFSSSSSRRRRKTIVCWAINALFKQNTNTNKQKYFQISFNKLAWIACTPINGSFYIYVKISFFLLVVRMCVCGVYGLLPPACKLFKNIKIDFCRFCSNILCENRLIQRTRRMPPVLFLQKRTACNFSSSSSSIRESL